ncbi:MAG TPA: NTP transferase domain-containing protein [Stellaceae bacterium]|nr:NTP transferase domain-containing protein [Stellaceae bacterium]
MRVLAMIPARMGSQRLARKNLLEIRGAPLIAHAARKCVAAGVFDEIWINADHPHFALVAEREGVCFHPRPPALASDTATSEEFVAEFLRAHQCDLVVQVHSIAPLLTAPELKRFVAAAVESGVDVTLSVVEESLEHLCRGEPVNFSLTRKTNSQDLPPVQRVAWSVTAWRREAYLAAAERGDCATYAGRLAVHPIGRLAGHVIKTQEDFDIADALWDLAHGPTG